MDNQAPRNDAIAKLADLIKQVQVCMLTTVEPDGSLHSRPMAVQQTEFDGDLWFFTGAGSPKTREIRQDAQVNVAFAEPKNQTYISMAGVAHVVHDPAKARELWSPVHKAFFPNGPDDPNLVLIKVVVDQAEYWDAPSSTVVNAYRLAKAVATGETYQEQAADENRKLDL